MRYWGKFHNHRLIKRCQSVNFLPKTSRNFNKIQIAKQKLFEITWSSQNNFKKVSSWKIRLTRKLWWNEYPLSTTTTQLLSQSLLSYILDFSTTNNLEISDAAKCSKSAPTRFAARTTCLPENKRYNISVTCASAPNFLPRFRNLPL